MTPHASRLHADLAQTTARLRALGALPVDIDRPAGGLEPDVDLATSAQEQVAFIGSRERLWLHHRAVSRAIERDNAGTLDVCVLCDGPIGAKRLEALMTAETCIGCATSLEIRARRVLAARGFDEEEG